jgi:hypothetical protein
VGEEMIDLDVGTINLEEIDLDVPMCNGRITVWGGNCHLEPRTQAFKGYDVPHLFVWDHLVVEAPDIIMFEVEAEEVDRGALRLRLHSGYFPAKQLRMNVTVDHVR